MRHSTAGEEFHREGDGTGVWASGSAAGCTAAGRAAICSEVLSLQGWPLNREYCYLLHCPHSSSLNYYCVAEAIRII